jgi:hypothetical protein
MTPNFSVEQSYRNNSGKNYQDYICEKYGMVRPPMVLHPNRKFVKRRRLDGMKTMWGKRIFFEITTSIESMKMEKILSDLKAYKHNYPECIFVVIVRAPKAPRDCDGLDNPIDELKDKCDYVLIGEDEVTQFINSPKQPIKNYKLKPQTQMTTQPNQLNTETSVKLMMSNGYSLETINQFMSFAYGTPIQVVVKDKTSVKKKKYITGVLEMVDQISQEQLTPPNGWVSLHQMFNKKSSSDLNELGKGTFENWKKTHRPQFVKVLNRIGTWNYYTNVTIK